MPTYKNIRIKMKNGKTRLQRVQVLASGKYKFVKNLTTSRKSSPGKRRNTNVAKNKKGNGKLLGNYGPSGLLEDVAIGYIGTQIIMGQGYPMESAMPMTRVIQGVAGHALGRRGKGRLAYGVIDLIDVYLIKQGVKLPFIGNGLMLEAWR